MSKCGFGTSGLQVANDAQATSLLVAAPIWNTEEQNYSLGAVRYSDTITHLLKYSGNIFSVVFTNLFDNTSVGVSLIP